MVEDIEIDHLVGFGAVEKFGSGFRIFDASALSGNAGHHMSVENHAACTAGKLMVTVPSAGHGTCYMQDPELYLDSLDKFFGPLL